MNFSLRTHSLPGAWKIASVTPIYKKGDKLNPQNYRPISLTSVLCKSMESIVCDKIKAFMVENNVIPVNQHGFMSGRSVATNLLNCVNDWTVALDSNTPIDIVYLDFSKAFDRVPKERLLLKLEYFGVRGSLLKWIDNFLSNRSFSVRIGSSYSTMQPVLSGVPQGSVLGPLLFIVYTCDLPNVVMSNCSMYADDTKLYCNPITSHQQLQNDLKSINEWCDKWLLPLNIDKCVVLHMGKTNPQHNYIIDNISLNNVSHHSDLGITITSDLNWSLHISNIVKKSNTSLYLLKKVFPSASLHTFANLFKTYVRPNLEFGGSVWWPSTVRDRDLLESVQRRATRLPFGVIRPPYANRLSMTNLTSVENRRLRGDIILTYRVLHNQLPSLRTLFTLNTDDRLRNHGYRLKKDNFRTSVRQNFLTNRVFLTWNNLPVEIVNASSLSCFKQRLDNNWSERRNI